MLAMKTLLHASPALAGSHCYLQRQMLHCIHAGGIGTDTYLTSPAR